MGVQNLNGTGDIDFSVLMPVYYKDDPFQLTEALNSLSGQTLKAAEIVLVVDGVIPGSLVKVIDEFKYDKTIKKIQLPENKGLANALNQGLRECSYEWVARMDSDDICHPERFERQISFLKRNQDIDVIGSNIEEFSLTLDDLKIFRKVPEKHDEILKLSKLRCPLNHMSILYRKSKVLDAGGYNRAFGSFEDYPLWVKMLQQRCIFYNIQEVLMYVRVAEFEMIKRRKGLKYANNERRLANHFLRTKHINVWQYVIWIFVRIPSRFIPSKILQVIYRSALRKTSI